MLHLRRSPKTTIFKAFCLSLATALTPWAGSAEAQHALDSTRKALLKTGASLRYPVLFKEVPLRDSPALLLLRLDHGSSLPSINVIQTPGRYDFKEPIALQKRGVIHSYKLAGFTDARCLMLKIGNRNGTAFAEAELSYSQSRRSYSSRLVIFSGKDRHHLITLTDAADAYPYSKHFLDPIVESFQAPDLQKDSDPSSGAPSVSPAVLLAAALLVVCAAGAAFRRRRKNATPSANQPFDKKQN